MAAFTTAGMIRLDDAIVALRQYRIDTGYDPVVAVCSGATWRTLVDESVERASRRGINIYFSPTGAFFLHGCWLRPVSGEEPFFSPQAARDPLIFGASA